ncbi:MAG: restriction endonuclease subunit S [Cyanobacteria bacterium P01_C01_bin.120]
MSNYQLSINNYQLPEGYKQTEVGVIPEDWDVKKLIDVVDYVDYRGKTPPKQESGVLLITARNIRDGYIDYKSSQEFVSEDDYDKIMRRGKPKIGDVLITTEAPLGMVAAADIEYVALAQRVIKYRAKESNLDQSYLKYYLLSERFQRILQENSSGSTAQGIKGSVLHTLPIIIASLEEQRAIATALSDIDALIAALDKLIAKQRHLKTATMQQLLTGKKRLPKRMDNGELIIDNDGNPVMFGPSIDNCQLSKGYKQTEVGVIPEDWEVHTLHHVCNAIVDGTHYTPNYFPDGIPFYSVENVTANDFQNTRFISEQEHLSLIKRCKPEKGDILLTRIGSLGATRLIDWDVNASIYVSLALLKLNERVIPEYVYVYSKSRQFVEDVEKRSLVNATPQKINMEDIGKVPLPVPQSEEEQRAIATVLSDMDDAIAALEASRAKTQAIKQGMMQELLTGRTRLV